RRHPRSPPPAADRRADRLRGARRGVLPHEPRVLRPGRRVHHHRTRRRDRVPRRHHAEGAPVITIDAVRKQYTSATETVEIGPVTVEIPSGGVTALVGPNGAGKSTLLTMAGRLLGIDDGAIEVAGYDIASTASKDLAKILSVLRQENHFITRLTVRQLVGFGRFPYSKGRLTRLDEQKISEAIDFLNLDDLEDRYLDQLSGGQRQRAYVAMVLAQDTEYVLLDEPLNNL